ncbi:MAG: hypothetical protein ACI4F7_08045 [Acutalibacteraceae bacterium]
MLIRYIIITLLLCLSMLGLAELLHGIKLRLTAPRRKALTYSVVLLSGNDPEEQLLFAVQQKMWLGSSYSDYIIAVNNGLDKKRDKACRYIAEKYGVNYLTPEELKAEIGEYIPLG